MMSLLLILIGALLAAPIQSAPAQTAHANGCPVSLPVPDYPAGPNVSDAWYANADRTIWAFLGDWDFVRRGPDQPDPKTGYVPGQKVLWYKPASPLIVTGRRTDGANVAASGEWRNGDHRNALARSEEVYRLDKA
jgi:hypothetical protein